MYLLALIMTIGQSSRKKEKAYLKWKEEADSSLANAEEFICK